MKFVITSLRTDAKWNRIVYQSQEGDSETRLTGVAQTLSAAAETEVATMFPLTKIVR